MTNDLLVVMYLFYGFTFILMGIYAIREYQRTYSVFPLVNAIIYLGIFGIAHGISEWLTMLRYANVFESLRVELFFLSRIFKAVSFLALIQFGFTLLFKSTWRKIGTAFLMVYFGVFLSVFYVYVFVNGIHYLYDNPGFLIITLRYMMALPGAALSMIVLIYQGLKVKNLDRLWMKYYFYLATVIMIYGILDGLFVRQADFFPANVLYNQWFIEIVGVPIQVLKIIVGVALYVGVHLVINSFAWEQNNKWLSIKTEEEQLRQKQRLNQMLHDDLIQSLYIEGLKMEDLKATCEDVSVQRTLNEAIDLMNQSIKKIRGYIGKNRTETLTVHDFDSDMEILIDQILQTENLRVNYRNLLGRQGLHAINKTILTQLYYIARELLLNVVKHAQAERVNITIYQEVQYIKLIVEDDGVGFDVAGLDFKTSFGIDAIHERIETINGSVKFHSKTSKWFRKSKTQVTVYVPVEVDYA